jgi:23S rRNA pseudouridine2605 synthase
VRRVPSRNEKTADSGRAGEKLQKVLARAGHGSRRVIETWISEGRVKINGRVAKLGDRVSEDDQLFLDDRPVTRRAYKTECRVLALNKAEGVVCTRADPEHRATLFESLPRLRGSRWIAVGRLDINTSGLILLTTDGELAHKLMHPSTQIEREYAVRVFGGVAPETIERLKTRVMLDDGPAHFDDVIDAGGSGLNHWFHVILKEGRQREVRRLWESQGVQVSRLIRVRYGPIALRRGLRAGKFDELDAAQIDELRVSAGLARADGGEKSEQRPLREKRPARTKRAPPRGATPSERPRRVAGGKPASRKRRK